MAAVAVCAALLASNAVAQNAPDIPLANGAPAEKPNRDYNGMVIGGWLYSPALFVGGIYDSNINQTATNKVSGFGERVVPSFTAALNNGIHRTDIYGLVDGRFYQGAGANNDSQVAAKTGLRQIYEARRDLVFTANIDYTRQQDVFGSWAFAQNTPAPGMPATLSPPTTISPQTSPTFYNQFTGSVSVQRTLNRAFVSLGASAQSTVFDHNPNADRNGTISTVPIRLGYYVTPQVYLFSDSALDWRNYANSAQNSRGYRLTGGFGTNQGIWAGEIYGGYQAEKNDTLGTFGGDIIGARLFYSPTRLWTLRAQVDESLSAVAISGGPGTLTGTASRVANAILYATYNGLPMGWTGNARFGFVRTAAVDSPRVDNGWLVGVNVSYALWRNLSVTLDYQYTKLASNIVNQSFDKHMVSLGMSYRY